MNKQLTVSFSSENEGKVVSSVLSVDLDYESIERFTSWVWDYKLGDFDEVGNIICYSSRNFIACRRKALSLGLLPTASLTEVRARVKTT